MVKYYRRKVVLFVGVLLIVSACFLFQVEAYQKKCDQKEENQKIETFFKQETKKDNNLEIVQKKEILETSENPYIAILEIPTIQLKKGLYDIYDLRNHVEKNIQILEESHFPNEANGDLILVGHSGIGKTAYFNHLNELKKGDFIYLYYQGIKYTYQLSFSYEIEKTGYFYPPQMQFQKRLILITCKKNTQKQLVFVANLYHQEGI